MRVLKRGRLPYDGIESEMRAFTEARKPDEARVSRPSLQVSDLGETYTPANEQALLASAEVITRREPAPPISAIEQTAVGDPTQPTRPRIADDDRGDPRQIQRFEVLRRQRNQVTLLKITPLPQSAAD